MREEQQTSAPRRHPHGVRLAIASSVVALLSGLLGASPSLAGPPAGAEEPPAPAGARPDPRGRLVLPASGLSVKVPRAAVKTTEAFGRVAFVADGPEVSDEIGVSDPAGLLALSVVVGGPDCAAFEALGAVEREVRVGRHFWSRLDQSQVVIEGVTAKDAPMRAAVWCRPGILVHSVALEGHALLVPWLDALASARPPATATPTPSGTILLETADPDVADALPVVQRFALTATRALWETRLPVGRVPDAPGSRPLGAPARDRFELLTPRALLVAVTIEATAGRGDACPLADATGTGERPNWPAGFSAPTEPDPLAACLRTRSGGPLLVRVDGRGAPPLLLAAAAPILSELAALLAAPPRPPPAGD
jgi:hypothetical protein